MVSGHKYKIGQLVNYLGRERASGVYQVTQLLPVEDDAFQYRVNANEPHERVVKDHPAGQTLYILSGVGRVQSLPRRRRRLVSAERQTLATMAHVAITEVRDGKFVEWMEKVTDQQYQAAAG